MDLLQHNLDVQALLVSLPRDLAIWKAFVKNEKVQELMQSHNRKLPQLEDNGEAFGIDHWQEEVNPFLVMIHCVQNVVWEIMGTMVDIINSIFGFELFGEKDCDPFNKMFKDLHGAHNPGACISSSEEGPGGHLKRPKAL